MDRNNIIELLDYSDKQITSLKSKEQFSKFEVKNILENLRSALEYSAEYINYKLNLNKKIIYFPYGENKEIFQKSLIKNFGNIEKSHPDIFNLINELQPFSSNSKWLVILCLATNEVKHKKPLNINETNIEEKKISDLNIPGIKLGQFFIDQINNNKLKIEIKGVKFNNLPMDDFTIENGDIKIHKKGVISPSINFEIVNNKYLHLKDYECDLIELLESSHDNIKNFAEKLINYNFC